MKFYSAFPPKLHAATEPLHIKRGQMAVYCADSCGRYLTVSTADLDKLDRDWTCPICLQQQRDEYLTAHEPQPTGAAHEKH